MNGAAQVRSDPRPGRQLGQEATASGELGGMPPAYMGASGRMKTPAKTGEGKTIYAGASQVEVGNQQEECRIFEHTHERVINEESGVACSSCPANGPAECAEHTGNQVLDAFIKQALRDEAIIGKMKAAVIRGDRNEVFELAKELTK